jgi:hypothetical protein
LAQSFEELQGILKVGQRVFVSDESGGERNGKVADVTASSFTVAGSDHPLWDGMWIGLAAGGVGGAVAGYASHTWRSLPVGVGIGAAMGFLVDWTTKGSEGKWTFAQGTVTEIRATDPLVNGALIGAAIGTGLAMWDYLIDPSEPGNAAIFTAAIGLGTALGAGIDALTKKRGKVLYASPRQNTGVTISPLLGKDRQGVLVYVRF